MVKRRRKIRNLWLNPNYQGQYIIFLVASCFLVMSCYGVVFYLFIKENFDSIMEVAPLSGMIQENLANDLETTIYYLLLASGGFLISVALVGLLMSHKVAGPLLKIRNVCSRINRGEKDARIYLRPDDYFKDVAVYLNYTFDKLQAPEQVYYKVVKSRRHVGEIFNLEKINKLVAADELSQSDLVVEFERKDAEPCALSSVLKS